AGGRLRRGDGRATLRRGLADGGRARRQEIERMARQNKPIRSDIAWSTRDRIEVRGLSLTEDILGKLNLGDFSYLQLTGRLPTPQQSVVFNAILVTLVEHG